MHSFAGYPGCGYLSTSLLNLLFVQILHPVTMPAGWLDLWVWGWLPGMRWRGGCDGHGQRRGLTARWAAAG